MKKEVRRVDFNDLEWKPSEEGGYVIEDAQYIIISHLQPGHQWDLLERTGEDTIMVRIKSPVNSENGVEELTFDYLKSIPLAIIKTPMVHVQLDEASLTKQLRKKGLI